LPNCRLVSPSEQLIGELRGIAAAGEQVLAALAAERDAWQASAGEREAATAR
jgi:hypothetical protein